MKLTTQQRREIEELMNGAANHGDKEQIALCEAALGGDDAAAAECLRVLAESDN